MVIPSRWLDSTKGWTLPGTTSAEAFKSFTSIPPRWNPALRLIVFLACLAPFLVLVNAVRENSLGPDPAEHLMHVTGEWVMRFLVLVLLATPLARYGWPRLARYRRMLGLYAWFMPRYIFSCLRRSSSGGQSSSSSRNLRSGLMFWWVSWRGLHWCHLALRLRRPLDEKWDVTGAVFTG